MTVRDFRMVYGSGCHLSFGIEQYNRWLINNERLIHADEKLSEYDNAIITGMYPLNNGALAVVISLEV